MHDAPTRCINSKKVRRGTVGKCWKGEKLADRCFRQRIRNIIPDNFICFKNERFSEPKSRKPRLKFFWLQIGLAPRRCSLLTPSLFTLPSKMKTSIFFLSRHGLVSRIFLIPMIKKKKKDFIFFISKRNKTNLHATRWREFEPSGIGSSRLVSIGEFQFKSMPCSKNQSSSSTDRYIGAKFMNRAPINQYYRVAVVKIADSFLLKGSRA